jgi:RNA 2',3'-cyclic 3'-phosphodiesterase
MTHHTKKIRAFMAFTPPAQVAAEIKALQQAIDRHRLNIKWVAPENIHLTLKFLGDITPQEIEAAGRAAAQTTATVSSPLSVTAKGIGVFPNYKRPRILWTGLSGETAPLFEFQKKLDANLENAGFEREPRPFKAHLTIGRIKSALDGKTLGTALDNFLNFQSKPFYLETFILYKSVLGSQGPTYTRLATFSPGETKNEK